MKNLSWFNKVIFSLNIGLTVLTIAAYILPLLAPKVYPILSVLTLFLPFILILNLLFCLFWAFQLKRQAVLSGLMLLIGITFINRFYKFSETEYIKEDGDFGVMSYNVRLFNKFGWSDKKTVPVEISDFVKEHDPSILCIQEFSKAAEFDHSGFPYEFIYTKGKKIKGGYAIFSKYPIIETGHVEFPDSNNITIFIDVNRGKDTIRIYNMHLESLRITPDVREINEDINEINDRKSRIMLRSMSQGFKKQQLQSELIMKHKKDCKYPIIVCGDMNNSAFSYVYRNIRGDLNDSFVEAGGGFGKSYDFDYYPVRIDYVLTDKKFKVKSFQVFQEIVDSDHFPVMAILADQKED